MLIPGDRFQNSPAAANTISFVDRIVARFSLGRSVHDRGMSMSIGRRGHSLSDLTFRKFDPWINRLVARRSALSPSLRRIPRLNFIHLSRYARYLPEWEEAAVSRFQQADSSAPSLEELYSDRRSDLGSGEIAAPGAPRQHTAGLEAGEAVAGTTPLRSPQVGVRRSVWQQPSLARPGLPPALKTAAFAARVARNIERSVQPQSIPFAAIPHAVLPGVSPVIRSPLQSQIASGIQRPMSSMSPDITVPMSPFIARYSPVADTSGSGPVGSRTDRGREAPLSMALSPPATADPIRISRSAPTPDLLGIRQVRDRIIPESAASERTEPLLRPVRSDGSQDAVFARRTAAEGPSSDSSPSAELPASMPDGPSPTVRSMEPAVPEPSRRIAGPSAAAAFAGRIVAARQAFSTNVHLPAKPLIPPVSEAEAVAPDRTVPLKDFTGTASGSIPVKAAEMAAGRPSVSVVPATPVPAVQSVSGSVRTVAERDSMVQAKTDTTPKDAAGDDFTESAADVQPVSAAVSAPPDLVEMTHPVRRIGEDGPDDVRPSGVAPPMVQLPTVQRSVESFLQPLGLSPTFNPLRSDVAVRLAISRQIATDAPADFRPKSNTLSATHPGDRTTKLLSESDDWDGAESSYPSSSSASPQETGPGRRFAAHPSVFSSTRRSPVELARFADYRERRPVVGPINERAPETWLPSIPGSGMMSSSSGGLKVQRAETPVPAAAPSATGPAHGEAPNAHGTGDGQSGDVNHLANEVFALLKRRLKVEGERLGRR